MNMIKLTLITTHYDADEKIVAPFLKTVAAQQRIDWRDYEVVFVEDDPNVDFPAWDALLHEALPVDEGVTIKHLKPLAVNTGVADARQRGIDAARGAYFTIMDSDDYLYSTLVFRLFEQECYDLRDKVDIMWTDFWHEHTVDGKLAYTPQGVQRSMIWCFGNYFRRAWVKDQKLRFFSGQRAGDDSGFNQLALSFVEQERLKLVDMQTVVWADNKKSIAHNDVNQFHLSCNPDHMRSWMYVAHSKMLRTQSLDQKKAIGADVLGKIMACFFAMWHADLVNKDSVGTVIPVEEWRRNTEEMCAFVYANFKECIELLSREEESELERMARAGSQVFTPDVTWHEWKRRIQDAPPPIAKYDISWSHVWTQNKAGQGTLTPCYIDFKRDFGPDGRYKGGRKKR